jgi:hypothetical protein
MHYYSPFHFLPADLDISTIDATTIQRAKKKLLAELELDERALGGMTKDQMLKWIDSLNSTELTYHRFIYQHKTILNFLEHGAIANDEWYQDLPPGGDLHTFIIPLVQRKYDQLFTEAFKNADADSIKRLSTFQLPDLHSRGRYYYAGALNLFTAHYHQLLQLITDWHPARQKELEEFLSLPIFSIIPQLPSYFTSMRDEFALTLAKFAAQQCEKPTQESVQLAKHVLLVTSALGASEEATKAIDSIRKNKINTDETAAVDPSIKDDTEGTRKGCTRAFIIFFVIITLIRLIAMLLR